MVILVQYKGLYQLAKHSMWILWYNIRACARLLGELPVELELLCTQLALQITHLVGTHAELVLQSRHLVGLRQYKRVLEYSSRYGIR